MKKMKYHILTSLLLIGIGTQAQAAEPPVTEKLVNTFVELSQGPHAGYRVNHAKGILAEGTFTPSDTAKSLSMAPHLQSQPTDVIVRFSNATGVPNIEDNNPNAFPKGMAIRFLLPDQAATDIVVLSVDRFPVNTSEKFLGLLTAIKESQSTDVSSKPIETFLANNPTAKTFVELEKPAPVGFNTQNYHGINAFEFENEAGKTVYGRYLIEPVNGEQFLTDEQRQQADKNYLMTALSDQLTQAPLSMKISVQLAEQGDNVNDPTQVWPAERDVVELGTLTLNNIMKNGEEYAKKTMFNPLALPRGIMPSDDPVLLARPGAYAISLGRRMAE